MQYQSVSEQVTFAIYRSGGRPPRQEQGLGVMCVCVCSCVSVWLEGGVYIMVLCMARLVVDMCSARTFSDESTGGVGAMRHVFFHRVSLQWDMTG